MRTATYLSLASLLAAVGLVAVVESTDTAEDAMTRWGVSGIVVRGGWLSMNPEWEPGMLRGPDPVVSVVLEAPQPVCFDGRSKLDPPDKDCPLLGGGRASDALEVLRLCRGPGYDPSGALFGLLRDVGVVHAGGLCLLEIEAHQSQIELLSIYSERNAQLYSMLVSNRFDFDSASDRVKERVGKRK